MLLLVLFQVSFILKHSVIAEYMNIQFYSPLSYMMWSLQGILNTYIVG